MKIRVRLSKPKFCFNDRLPTDDGGGVLVLDVGWWETRGMLQNAFKYFWFFWNIFASKYFPNPLVCRGGEKVGTKVTLEFIFLLVYLGYSSRVYFASENISGHNTQPYLFCSAACAACWLCWLQQQTVENLFPMA